MGCGAAAMGFVGFSDRYVVPLALLMCIAIVSSTKKESPPARRTGIAASVFLVGVFGAYSITATHDYMAWNRARWDALDSLLANKDVTPDLIDGGFEFNGYYLQGRVSEWSVAPKSWWWVVDDSYMVCFGEVPGYAVVDHYEFTRWMPPGKGKIVVLRRQDGARGGADERMKSLPNKAAARERGDGALDGGK